MDARHFGVTEANRYVPLLQRTFTLVRAELHRLQEIDRLLERSASPAPDRLSEERNARLRRVDAELQNLVDLGIEIKAVDGLVDFRALLDGRTVYLCWRFGEERVEYWHELDSGFQGRRPIQETDGFAPTYDA
ncbi:MAG TPA: DUF2203 domain-containing protein [Myxococcaceae bacterium]|jgi:hypothetical protein